MSPVGAPDVRVAALRRHAWPAWRPMLLLAVLSAWWLSGLSLAPLVDVDEGAFAEASREMLASGDWGHTTLNGSDRFDKPIGVYWLQALSLAVFGVGEFAVRLPSALCAIGWTLAVFQFARSRWGPAAATLSAAVLATSLGPMLIGRAATADALLNLCLTLTMLDLWRFLEKPQDRWALRRAFLWAGLGLLAKGPVAVVLPLGALLLWGGLTAGGWARVRSVFADAPAWLLGLGVALPWYAYAVWRHGQTFVEGFFWRHNLDRLAGPLEGHGGSLLYYLWVLPLLMLPWTPMLPAVISTLVQHLRHRHRPAAEPALRFLACWCAFVLVFFSLSGTKLPHYALYGFTPVALICGHLLGRQGLSRGQGIAVAVTCALLVVVGGLAPGLAAWSAAQVADAGWRALLLDASLHEGPSVAWGALSLAAIAAGWLWARRQPGADPLVCAWPAFVTGLWWLLQVLPWWAAVLQGPVQRLAWEARERGLPLVQWQLHRPSAGFYRGQPAPRREPRPGEAALIGPGPGPSAWRDDTGGHRFEVLRREGPFVLVRARTLEAAP